MKDSSNTANKGFRKAWGMLPADKQPEIRTQIQTTCGWSTKTDTTFSLKLNGHLKLNPLEYEAIRKILAGWNIDIETGEYIKPLAEV